jgi:hypothetical protein
LTAENSDYGQYGYAERLARGANTSKPLNPKFNGFFIATARINSGCISLTLGIS